MVLQKLSPQSLVQFHESRSLVYLAQPWKLPRSLDISQGQGSIGSFTNSEKKLTLTSPKLSKFHKKLQNLQKHPFCCQ